MSTPPRLVVFAKAPQAGQAKTRLAPALGAEGAATLARALLHHALTQALAAGVGPVELCMSPAPDSAAWQGLRLPAGISRADQGEGDLGERMARAVQRVTTGLQQPVLLFGTDCPALDATQLRAAAAALHTHDAVLLPVADGGYVLIGLKAPCPALFEHMPWSTATVAAQTLQRLAALGLSTWVGPTLHDIDEPADLRHLPPHLQAN
ncbi:MAG: TIGR04282 family arsenosugar biosynthesis glycosyltransferase [Hylemonella sp.]|nr:TIGR04282 family arsenosugar biosynthesis glycosyltransferase [Hylemonella sp.]